MPTTDPHRPRAWPALLLAALTLLYAAVALVFAAHSRPNIDEGIYLWAGRLVSEGRLPYRDFPTAQGPMLSYALAAAPPWFGSPLLGGRAIATVAGVVGMAGALWLAQRIAGSFAALVTLLVAFATLPYLMVASTLRSQSLGTPLLVLGVAALALSRRGALGWSLAPSLLLWSSSLRLTNLAVFAAVSLWTAWQLRRAPARLARVAGIVGAQALVIGLPIVASPAHAYFHIVSSQWSRGERLEGAAAPSLSGIVHSLAPYLDQLPNCAALAALTAALAVRGAWRSRRGWHPQLDDPLGDPATAPLALAALGAIAFAPHVALASAFFEYLVPLWALLLPAVGIGVASALDRPAWGRAARFAVGFALIAFASWNAARSSDYWIGSGDESFGSFRRVAGELGRVGGPGCTMLTFETELAVEAGCRVFPGLEYSFFSYFPDLATEEAKRRGVTNLAVLRERVDAVAPELIALAGGHALRLLGRNDGAARAGALAFLGPLAHHYELNRRVWIPTSVRQPGGRGLGEILVFRRKSPPG